MRALSTEIEACDRIGYEASRALALEIDTYPKPGLVSHLDCGAHADMDAALMHRSASVLHPWFVRLAELGTQDADMGALRKTGLAAEAEMLLATGGVNTHRGAIFGLGLLAAAAGLKTRSGASRTLGELVADRWGEAVIDGPLSTVSHGGVVARTHGVGGARAEAAAGFPTVYTVALPALRAGAKLAPADPEAARVHACFALIATTADTNLLHRGGREGLTFAQKQARLFLDEGSISRPGWRKTARAVHQAFVARNLSPGGCADLLGFALFVKAVET